MCVVHSYLAVSYLCSYAEGQNPELKKKSLNSLTGVYATLLIHIPGHESSLSSFFVYMKTILYCYFVFFYEPGVISIYGVPIHVRVSMTGQHIVKTKSLCLSNLSCT